MPLRLASGRSEIRPSISLTLSLTSSFRKRDVATALTGEVNDPESTFFLHALILGLLLTSEGAAALLSR